MLQVGGRRSRHGHVPKTTMSDSASADLQHPCSMMLLVGCRRPLHGPAPKPTTSDSASADLQDPCSMMLLVGGRRPLHGPAPKPTTSDSSSTDLQGPCSKMLQVGGRRPLHGPVTNPPCQTLRVVPCEMTCLTHFILERTGSLTGWKRPVVGSSAFGLPAFEQQGVAHHAD
jgi:hypothetical protein